VTGCPISIIPYGRYLYISFGNARQSRKYFFAADFSARLAILDCFTHHGILDDILNNALDNALIFFDNLFDDRL
jgi:hypothetical protein